MPSATAALFASREAAFKPDSNFLIALVNSSVPRVLNLISILAINTRQKRTYIIH